MYFKAKNNSPDPVPLKSAENSYGRFLEILQKACEGCFRMWWHMIWIIWYDRKYWNAPKSNIYIFGSFLILKLLTCFFSKFPTFLYSKFLKFPIFPDSEYVRSRSISRFLDPHVLKHPSHAFWGILMNLPYLAFSDEFHTKLCFESIWA